MKKKFQIIQSSTNQVDKRPPISWKVRDYFEDFILDHVFSEKQIVLSSAWTIHLHCMFGKASERLKNEQMHFFDKPRTVAEEKVKIYEVIIPERFIDMAENKYEKTIELIYEAITLFLTGTYKKVSREFMSDLWQIVDMDYLLKLPYPAPAKEQKYLTDMLDSKGNIVDFVDIHRAKAGW